MDGFGQGTAPASASAEAAASSAPTSASSAGTGSDHRELGAAGPSPAPRSTMTPQLATAMRAYRNARYHEDREGFFNALNRWSNFFGILLGSGAFAGGAAAIPVLAMVGGALAAIVSAGRLVFDFSGKARVHSDLRKSFLEVLADAKRPDANYDDLEARMVDLYRSEPEVFNAVNAMAYNNAQIAFGRPPSTLISVDGWRKKLRHVRRFEPSDFPDAVLT